MDKFKAHDNSVFALDHFGNLDLQAHGNYNCNHCVKY